MRILSYGEDPLTYWVLSDRLDKILEQLEDPSADDVVVFIYRPSFGRGAGAQFGEFDAIVDTPAKTYLIEAKWHGSPEVASGVIVLRPEQYLRHEIFRWYRETWSEVSPLTWDEFFEAVHDRWTSSYPHRKLAPSGSTLATNLEFVLKQLVDCGPLQDVVLYVGLSSRPTPTGVDSELFRIVTLDYQGVDGTGYFEIPLPPVGSHE